MFFTLKIGFANLWRACFKREKKNTSVVSMPAAAE